MRAIALALAAFVGLALPARADTTTSRLALVIPSTGSLNWGLKVSDWAVKIDTGVAGLKIANTFIGTNTALSAWLWNGSSISLTGSLGFIVGQSSIQAASFWGDGANLTALNATQLLSGTIPAARIGSGAIDTSKLATDAVATANILNGAVTSAKTNGTTATCAAGSALTGSTYTNGLPSGGTCTAVGGTAATANVSIASSTSNQDTTSTAYVGVTGSTITISISAGSRIEYAFNATCTMPSFVSTQEADFKGIVASSSTAPSNSGMNFAVALVSGGNTGGVSYTVTSSTLPAGTYTASSMFNTNANTSRIAGFTSYVKELYK